MNWLFSLRVWVLALLIFAACENASLIGGGNSVPVVDPGIAQGGLKTSDSTEAASQNYVPEKKDEAVKTCEFKINFEAELKQDCEGRVAAGCHDFKTLIDFGVSQVPLNGARYRALHGALLQALGNGVGWGNTFLKISACTERGECPNSLVVRGNDLINGSVRARIPRNLCEEPTLLR